MEIQRAIHEINTLQYKIKDLTQQEVLCFDPSIKLAYSTIVAVHTSTLTVLNINLTDKISTIRGNQRATETPQ